MNHLRLMCTYFLLYSGKKASVLCQILVTKAALQLQTKDYAQVNLTLILFLKGEKIDRRRVLLGQHEQGDAAGDRRGAGRVGEGARRRGERHADVRVPQGRAHAGVQGAVGAADQGAARRPQELRRLHALVPPRRARRLERAALLEALLPRQRPGALTRPRRRSNMHRTVSLQSACCIVWTPWL